MRLDTHATATTDRQARADELLDQAREARIAYRYSEAYRLTREALDILEGRIR